MAMLERPAMVSPNSINSLRGKRSMRMPENRLARMGGVAVKNTSKDKGVACPVASQTQMVRAKVAILDPKTEAV
jgi:hypothetical protein